MLAMVVCHVLCVLVVTLCCSVGCVAAGGTTLDNKGETREQFLERVNKTAMATREKVQTIEEAGEKARRTAAIAADKSILALRKTRALHQAVRALYVPKVVRWTEVRMKNIVDLATDAGEALDRAHSAISATGEASAPFTNLAADAYSQANKLRRSVDRKKIVFGPKSSEMTSNAWNQMDAVCDFLKVSSDRSYEAFNAAVLAVKSAGNASRRAKQVKKDIRNLHEDRARKEGIPQFVLSSRGAMAMAKQTVELAVKVFNGNDAAVKNATTALEHAGTMMSFIGAAWRVRDEEASATPPIPAPRSPSESTTDETQQASLENDPKRGEHSNTLTAVQNSEQEQPLNTPAFAVWSPAATEHQESQEAIGDISDHTDSKLEANSLKTVGSSTRDVTDTMDPSTEVFFREALENIKHEDFADADEADPHVDLSEAGITTIDSEPLQAGPLEKKTDAESIRNGGSQAAGAPLAGPNSNADTTVRDAWSADSTVSPSWVRTPLLLVVGVLGLLAVC
ncbi:hypothetical protein DQ04_10021000 [Trypanosoma grayi]|uniref:hypothetical protein n=1 Tax=Trypanosoma grayi TaxID=71804 RepID=UPI0004F491BF|nr:hypothetical protein DQ04_10021000 [Trypanosoma grayi]KEG07364.1 hypothetical protein DQ04_10021000 [Trypanosoma grayi]